MMLHSHTTCGKNNFSVQKTPSFDSTQNESESYSCSCVFSFRNLKVHGARGTRRLQLLAGHSRGGDGPLRFHLMPTVGRPRLVRNSFVGTLFCVYILYATGKSPCLLLISSVSPPLKSFERKIKSKITFLIAKKKKT